MARGMLMDILVLILAILQFLPPLLFLFLFLQSLQTLLMALLSQIPLQSIIHITGVALQSPLAVNLLR